MKKVQVRLEFPIAQIQEPIVTHLVTDFDVSPNVLAANIDAGKGGWLLLEMSGEESQTQKALAWVRSKGIEVTEQ